LTLALHLDGAYATADPASGRKVGARAELRERVVLLSDLP
jgi:hypothetical protein